MDIETSKYNINTDLGFFDGLKNFMLTISVWLKNVIVASFVDAINANNGFLGGIMVFLFGLIKNIFVYAFYNIGIMFRLCFQEGLSNIGYIVGYLILPIANVIFQSTNIIFYEIRNKYKKDDKAKSDTEN